MDLMCRKGERVEFKIFAMLISFKTHCFRGEDDHLKAAINLFLLRFGGENHLKAAINLSCFAIQIATFPTGKIGVSLPRTPSLLGWANICNLGRRQKLNTNDVNAAVNVYTQTK